MALKSFIDVPRDSHFPVGNFPFGVFKPREGAARIGVALGEHVVDLAALEHACSNAARSTTCSPSATPIRAAPSRGLKTPNGRFSSGKCESRGTSMKDLSAIKKEDSERANLRAAHRSCSCRTKSRIFAEP